MAEAMLNGADGVYKRKRIHMVETQNEDVQKYTFPINVLTTAYALNKSNSKKIIVGLRYNEEDKTLEPTIQLLNYQHSHGIILSSDTWSKLQNCVPQISTYFDEPGSRTTPNRLNINDLDVIYTTSYGVKSIIFDKHSTDVEEGSSRLTPKKKKNFTPAVIIQKRTFQGLRQAMVCVEERYRRLLRITPLINQCKDFILAELKSFISITDFQRKNSEDFVRDVICEKALFIKEGVKNKFSKKKRL